MAGTFDHSLSTGSLTMYNKFHGAAAVGTLVIFAPFSSNAVGVYDVMAGTFDHSVSTGSLKMYVKFNGAAAVDTLVIFAPFNADVPMWWGCTTW
eukprot:6924676-Prymnesium_polylepis.1